MFATSASSSASALAESGLSITSIRGKLVAGVVLGSSVAGALAWLWKRTPSSLRSFEDIRRMTVNVSATLLIALLALMVAKATFEDTFVVDQISVPKSLETAGYTGNVVAQRLIDEINAISTKAATTKARVPVASHSRYDGLSGLQVPSSNFSIRSIVTIFRDFFGIEDNKISGEVTTRFVDDKDHQGAGSHFKLLVRMSGPAMRASAIQESDDLDEAIRLSSRAVMNYVDPYVVASYWYAVKQGDEADKIVNRLIASGDKQTKAWAYNLRGLRLEDQGRLGDAVTAFRTAIANDPKLANGYANWGRVLSTQGQRDEAISKYREALKYAPQMALLHNNLGAVLYEEFDYKGAIEEYRKAVELDPNLTLAYRNWADALARQAHAQDANEKYQSAIDLNPHEIENYTAYASALIRQGKAAEAIGKYREALAVDPTSAEAYLAWKLISLGEIRSEFKRTTRARSTNFERLVN
jgi:tetratricopeptide (TPR) repeat protein